MTTIPLEFETAAAFVAEHHRHHTPPAGHKFSLGARDLAGLLAGVVIVGRPVARRRQDGLTLEVTRLCIRPGLAKVVDARGREHADGTCSFHPKRRIVREEPVERKDRMRVNRVRRVDMVAHALLSSSVQWAAVIFAARRAAAPTAILVSSPLAGRRR